MKGQIGGMNKQSGEGTADNQITFKNAEGTKTLTLSYDEKDEKYKVELTTNKIETTVVEEEKDKKYRVELTTNKIETTVVEFCKTDIILGHEQIERLQKIFNLNFDYDFLKNNTQGIKDNEKMFFGLFEKLEELLRETKKAYEIHNNNTKDNDEKYYISSLEQIYFVKKNKYPKWFSLGGALNFDYDFSVDNINGNNSCYWKLDNNDLKTIDTRNNNGWITENGWIDRTIDWFSNFNCRECNNAEPEINNETINDELEEGQVAEPA